MFINLYKGKYELIQMCMKKRYFMYIGPCIMNQI